MSPLVDSSNADNTAMKILKTVSDSDCANYIRYVLNRAGIPTYVSEDRTYTVWVYFDSQFQAAKLTLSSITAPNSCQKDVMDFESVS